MIQIANDPLFDEDKVSSRVQNLWMQLLMARADGNLEPLKLYFSEALYAREEALIREAQQSGRPLSVSHPAILNWTMQYQGVREGRETLLCQMMTRSRPMEKDAAGELREGSETFYRETWSLSRPAGTKTPAEGDAISVRCAGCGGHFSMYQSAKCPFCGNLIRVPDFTWTVEEISCAKTVN